MVLKSLSACARKLLLASGFWLLVFNAAAQQGTISGTVTDSTGKALDGASISVLGMPIATVTNTDGKYSISVPAQAIKIVFSYAGLKADTLNLKLQPGELRVVNRSLRSGANVLPEFTKEETSVTRINMIPINPKILN